MKENINHILRKAVINIEFLKELHNEILRDEEVLVDRFDGSLDSETLSLLLSKKRTKQMQTVIPWAIQYFGDQNSVSTRCFSEIKYARKKFKRSCMIAMAHINLPFYQLWDIHQCGYAFESFDSLFDYICHYDCFHLSDMDHLLHEAHLPKEIIEWNIQHAESRYGNNEKIELAKAFIKTNE